MNQTIARKNLEMLKTISDQAGAKLDTAIAASVAGTVSLGGLDMLDAFVEDHGPSFLFLGAIILLAVRVAIAVKQYRKE